MKTRTFPKAYERSDFLDILILLGDVRLRGLEGLPAKELLYLPLYMRMLGAVEPTWKSLAAPFVANTFSYEVDNAGSEVVLFCSGRYWARRDMRVIFNNVASSLGKPCTIIGTRKILPCISHVANLASLPTWRSQLISARIPDNLIPELISVAAKSVNFQRLLDSNAEIFRNTKVAVTLFDQDYDEYIFVKHCQQMGIITVTLQHGHFQGRNYDEDISTLPFPYTHLNADYFFAWGEVSRRRAVGCGVDDSRVIVAGNPKHIHDDSRSAAERAENQTMTVILDGGLLESASNIRMLEICERVFVRRGYVCNVKFHPGQPDQAAAKFIYSRGYFNVVDKDVQLGSLSRMSEVFVASKSSAYCELLHYGSVVFRYVEDPKRDRYREIEYGAFSNEGELDYLVEEFEVDPVTVQKKMQDNSSCFFYQGDVAKRYKDAINALIANNVGLSAKIDANRVVFPNRLSSYGQD